ncbi:hypothetical protein HYU11_02210 [Candidatus Woesearchaeota archaeon]|nr:hypothetical protein [Candidatus Woesearchaeota archaeon]
MREFLSKYRLAIFGASAILTSVLAYFGAKKVKSRIDDSRKLESFVDEWNSADPDYYRRRVALVVSSRETSDLERILQGNGYGVLNASNENAILAVETVRPDLILTDPRTIPGLRGDEVSLNRTAYAVRAVIPDTLKRSGIRRFLAEMDERIERRNDRIYRLLMKVLEYAGAARDRDFHHAPENVSAALRDFVSSVCFVAPYDMYDAHQGGVVPNFNGNPVRLGVHYDAGEGMCIKLFRVSDHGMLERLVEDIKDDSGISVARSSFARHHFYAVSEDGKLLIDVISYFINPTFAYIGNFVKESGVKQGREIRENLMHAIFEVAVAYGMRQQKRNPMTPQRVASVVGYYKNSLESAYSKLLPIMGELGIAWQDFVPLIRAFDDPDLKRGEFYSRVMDLLVSNFKLAGFNIQNPSNEELRASIMPGEKALSAQQIMERLQIYDQGYKDSHIADNFSRAAFSHHFGGIDNDWIRLAMDYARLSVGNNGLFGMINGIRGTPTEAFMKNFSLATAQKLFRLICYSVIAAEHNETGYASGMVQPPDYIRNRRNYVENALSYSRSLWLFTLTASYYFEGKMPRGYKEMWERTEDCYGRAKSSHGDSTCVHADLSRVLSTYSLIGRRIVEAHDAHAEEGPVFEMLKNTRERMSPFIVRYCQGPF